MNDGDYKFALKVRDQYKDLLNKINNKKTGGYLIIEIVPKDQKHNEDVVKPKKGDKVDVWGAWVTDKPKGCMNSSSMESCESEVKHPSFE